MKTRTQILKLAVITAWLFIIGVAHAQTTNVWVDNLESPTVWDNWSVDNGVWEIGAPLTGPATNSAGYRTHEGTNCAATVLAGNYPASTSSRLIRNIFVVPSAAQNPRLQFWHYYSFSGSSYGVVQIRIGTTGTWVDLSPRYYATGSGVWTRPVVDLSAYAGKAVQIAFQIVADGNVADGWDVDEVRVIKGPYQTFASNVAESFELGLGDWYAETGTWEVGVPTSGPATNAVGQRAYSGTNCLATVLAGDYEDNRSSRFVSPPFTVPTADLVPRLRFWEWFSVGGNDWMQVQIKVGTNAWQGLSDSVTADSFDRWTRAYLDLTAYAGQTVQVGFYFESHQNPYYPYNLNPGPGWYVDDVVIETGTPPPLVMPEGFETGWGGWQVDYIGGRVTDFGIWEIGKPTYGPPTNAFGQRAYSGTNCAATVLNGDYPDNRSARLVSPPFTVPTADLVPRLRFWEWFSVGGNDWMQVQIKVGTNAWQGLSDSVTADSFDRWTRAYLDLTAYAGQTVQVGFYFESHQNPYYPYNLNPGPGWYVDDVVIETGTPPPLVMPEGFETGWGGWQVDYIGGRVTDFGIWEIGKPTYGPPTNAFGQRAYSGTNCAATVLNGDYPDNRSAQLVSPPFVVPQLGAHPVLRFWHWFSIGGNDLCELHIKPVGGGWRTLAQYAGSSGVWSRPSFDLSEYAGQTVQVGFYFESHQNPSYPYNLNPGPGWYVDDVQITSVTPPTGIVEFTDARYFVNEGGGSATISVARKYGSAGAMDVTYVATDGTAVGGVDFDSVVDVLSWADGEQGVKTFTVPITQDALIEGNETVTLELIVPGSMVSSVARSTATLVIIDDDGVLPLSTNITYLRSLVVTTNYVATNTTSLFTVDGTVTTYTNLGAAADELFFMQDNTNGIAVLFRGGTNQFMPQAGDRVRVTAALTNTNGLLVLSPNYANITNVVWRLSASNALPTPAVLDFATRTNVPVMEVTEARYVSASQVTIDQTGGGTFPTVLTDLVMTNQSGQTFSLTIHPNTDMAGKPKPAGPVTILGVLNQNDSTAPYTTNYALLPTRYADIITAPMITGQPQSRTNGVGTTASFTVTAAGTDPLYYQWRRAGTNLLNGGNVSGIASNVLTLANVQLADATNYSVVVTNYLGSVTSSVATLTVVVPASITTQPLTQTVDSGTDVTFTVGAAGSAPFSYQWYWNSSPINGATNAILVLSAVTTNWSGTFQAVVNNAANLPATSSNAVLTVIQVPHGDPVPPDGVGFGNFTKTNNVYTVTGGGEDIEGTEDRFLFVHLPWTGDGEIMANLKSLVPADPHSEAGLMFRDGMAGGARHVFLAMDAENQKVFRRRLAVNAYSLENVAHGTNNVWLKLMRMGDTFTGHYSTNGVNWELVWWTTQTNLPATLEVGLAVTAHKNGSYATAVFEMVGPRNLTPLSGPWPLAGPQIHLGGEPAAYPSLQSLSGFKLLATGAVGDQFSVKYAADVTTPFASWTSLGVITNQYGVVPFLDPQALTNEHRYYRLQKVGP